VKRILVVDDNEMLCRLSFDILRCEGYLAVPAVSAAEALQAFETEDFDLVITDFLMPGMNGVDLARTIASRKPNFPVIIMSAYEPVECEHVRLWLPKEYLFPTLLEKVRICLKGVELAGAGK